MKLYTKEGVEVVAEDIVVSFKNEVAKILCFTEPKHAGSTGRVYVEFDEGIPRRQEFFPSVFGLVIK